MATKYTEAELKEIIAAALWVDPLKTVHAKTRDKHYVAGEADRAKLPNWQRIKRRERRICYFCGLTLEISRELIGSGWVLYLNGNIELTRSKDPDWLQEKGTHFLIVWMVKQQAKEAE